MSNSIETINQKMSSLFSKVMNLPNKWKQNFTTIFLTFSWIYKKIGKIWEISLTFSPKTMRITSGLIIVSKKYNFIIPNSHISRTSSKTKDTV